MKILVALDGAANSDAVFDIALRQIQNKKTDSLYLLCAAETPASNPIPFGRIFSSSKTEKAPSDVDQYDPKGEYVSLLTKYASRCDSNGIDHHPILGVAEHVGTLICQAVTEKGIDLVVLGRRKFGSFERLFAGSTSKYCIENAPCNVLVVKDDAPAEVHSEVNEVIDATERERERRIREEEIVEVHSDLDQVRALEEAERRRRVGEMGGAAQPTAQVLQQEKFDQDLRRNITRMAEEEERQRRIREDEAIDNREKIEREMAVHAAIRAEEKEKARRILEDKALDQSEDLSRQINQQTADLLEEKERERRLEEEVPRFIDRSLQVELLGMRQA
jgi:nucleotide-binding universal stress UspA family protein